MRSSAYRLPLHPGELIDRTKPLQFTFENRRYAGYAGDTVASALAANGVGLLSRSFKYHRPRGIMSLAGCEANTLVEVNGVPNVPAERHVLADGDRVSGQNYVGSLSLDCSAWIGALGRFFPVGFYYRAFFRPKGAWRFWEPVIRRMAGLGRIDTGAHHGLLRQSLSLCRCRGRRRRGRRVERRHRSGARRAPRRHHGRQSGLGRRAELRALRCRRRAGGKRARCACVAPCRLFPTSPYCRGKLRRTYLPTIGSPSCRAADFTNCAPARVVLATGALEQPTIFRNNDLPGVLHGSAAQRLIRLYGVRPGRSCGRPDGK